MKSKYLVAIISCIALLSSCVTYNNFYQIYKTNTSDAMSSNNEFITYEDENCIISYDLWDRGGNIGFNFYNKSNENLYLIMDESFFILNGIAHDYYKGRSYSNSLSSGILTNQGLTASKSLAGQNSFNFTQTNRVSAEISQGISTAKGVSITTEEQKLICIPSKASKIIKEYSISETRIKNCDLLKYPTKKQVKTIFFSKEDSPIVFSNRLTYRKGTNDKLIKIENEFYVSEITNYPESEVFTSDYEKFCGEESLNKVQFFKIATPDRFYIDYINTPSKWKH